MKKIEKDENKLEEAISEIRKKYGTGAVIQETEQIKPVESWSTGSFILDKILGSGLPKGRLVEVFGEESSGKSTLCLFLASQIQKQGGTVAYLDAENAYNREYANNIGVKTKDLLVSQPETLEEAADIIRAYAASKAVDLLIVDSVAALTPRQELEGEGAEMLKETMAVQARLLGKAIRILTGPISRSKMTVVFINQLRSKIGVFYGKKTETPGGRALRFYASIRLNVFRGEKIEGKKGEQIGTVLKITAVKNKVAFPWKSGEISLYFGSGVDLVADTFDTAVELKVVEKSGNTYSYGEDKIGVGRGQAIEVLKGAPELYKKIHEATKKIF